MKKANKLYTNFIIVFSLFLIACQMLSCKSAKKESGKNNYKLQIETDKEGFIDKNTFRVILIIPADEQTSENELLNLAKKRSYLSLKRYLIQRKVSFNSNINSTIINLVNNYGKIKKRKNSSNTRHCYYYDIVKDNLKKDIDNLK